MSGSTPKRPHPSYEDGKLRDREIAELQEQAAEAGDDQRASLLDLIKRAAPLASE